MTSVAAENTIRWHDQYSILFDQYLDFAYQDNGSSATVEEGKSRLCHETTLSAPPVTPSPNGDLYVAETESPLSLQRESLSGEDSLTNSHATPTSLPYDLLTKYSRKCSEIDDQSDRSAVPPELQGKNSSRVTPVSHLHHGRNEDVSQEFAEITADPTPDFQSHSQSSPLAADMSYRSHVVLWNGNTNLIQPRSVSDSSFELSGTGYYGHRGSFQPEMSTSSSPCYFPRTPKGCSTRLTCTGQGTDYYSLDDLQRNVTQHERHPVSPSGTDRCTWLMADDLPTMPAEAGLIADAPAYPSSYFVGSCEPRGLNITYAPKANLDAALHNPELNISDFRSALIPAGPACAMDSRNSLIDYTQHASGAPSSWDQYAALKSRECINASLCNVPARQILHETSISTMIQSARRENVPRAHWRSKTVSPASPSIGKRRGRRVASVGFVNFTPVDSQKILAGVAPSGSSKTKARREREAAERRRRLGEVAAKLVQEAGGDSGSLERDGWLL